MKYVLFTNRPERAEFAYEQYLKWPNVELVVIDNYPEYSQYWPERADYYHIPHSKSMNENFNWFVDNYKENDDIFMMDDDVELHYSISSIGKYIKTHQVVFINQVYCTHLVDHKTAIWQRRERQIGSVMMISKFIWPNVKFADKGGQPDGSYMFHDMIRYMVDKKHVFSDDQGNILVNYLIHPDCAVMWKNCKFNWTLPELHLD